MDPKDRTDIIPRDTYLRLILGLNYGQQGYEGIKAFRSRSNNTISMRLYDSNVGNALAGKLASYAAIIRNNFPSSCFLAIKTNPNGLPDFS